MAATLGVIAGRGDLPGLVVEACQRQQRPCFVIAFEGDTDPACYKNVPYELIGFEKIGKGLKALTKNRVKDLVMVGQVGRPELTKLRPDVTTVRLLASILRFRNTGDDALFKAIIAFLEGRGFIVHGVQEVLPEIMAPRGVIGDIQPDARAQNDMSLGLEVARRIGEYDVGQAVVIQGGRVIGVEAAEGTDALLGRVKGLQTKGPGGVLVKVKKPRQDSRIDLPAVGPRTVEMAAAAGLRGIAVEAGSSIIIHRGKMIQKANELGVFLYGIKDNG